MATDHFRIREGFGPLVPRQELAQLGELWSTEGGDLRGVPQTRAGFDASRGIIPTPFSNLEPKILQHPPIDPIGGPVHLPAHDPLVLLSGSMSGPPVRSQQAEAEGQWSSQKYELIVGIEANGLGLDLLGQLGDCI